MCESTREIRTSLNIQTRTALNTKCYQKRRTDYNLLKEILSCCRGLESDVIKFEESGYTIPKEIFLENSQVINQLLELAYLYRSARKLIEKQQNCLVSDAFLEVVQKYLSEYELAITELWASISSCTSLKTALPWTRQAMITLQFIVIILSATQKLLGGAILNPILKYVNHGNAKISDIFRKFLIGASKPLYSMIKHWVFKGVINDPRDEFFIYENTEVFGRNRWNSQFVLRNELIPNKFTEAEANLIVDIGKCVYFLRQYWKEDETYKNEIDKFKYSLEFIMNEECHMNPGENPLIIEMKKIHLLNTNYVLKVLKEDYSLLNFFTNLHHYILLGQGDFARQFMEAMQQMETHKYERMDVSIDPLLRNILHNITYGQKRSDLMNNINVHINNSTASEETIFEAFSLRYSIKGPLKMIFQAYESDYHLLFIFLWRKTYMQYKLGSISRDLFHFKKYDDQQSNFSEIVKELYFLKYQMTNFMWHLEYYIVHEIIEKEWYCFLKTFSYCISIDDVINAHERMLKRIFMGTLMDNNHKKLNVQIKVIFDLIEEFQKLVNLVIKLVMEKRTRDVIKLKVRAKINVLSSNYMKSVTSFKRLLKMCHHVDSLSALYDRIDFNRFYSESK